MNPQNTNPSSNAKYILTVVIVLIVVGLALYFFNNPRNTVGEKLVSNSQVDSTSGDRQKIIELYNSVVDGKEYTPEMLKSMNVVAGDIAINVQNTDSIQYTKATEYKFKTLWGVGTMSDRTKGSKALQQLEFKNGNKLILSCMDQSPRDDLTKKDQDGNLFLPKADTDQMLNFLGSKADSGFDFMNLLFTSTVESIKSQNNLESAEALVKLLTIKPTTANDKTPYRFNVGGLKGFQYGNYSVPQSTLITFFPSDKKRCDIMTKEGLSQKDADIIISTFSAI